jgi:hypothetical protein
MYKYAHHILVKLFCCGSAWGGGGGGELLLTLEFSISWGCGVSIMLALFPWGKDP